MTLRSALISDAVLIATVAVLDASTRWQYSVAALYAIPVVLAGVVGPPALAWGCTGVGTLLIAGPPLGFAPLALSSAALANRAIALAVVWCVTVGVIRICRANLALADRSRELADLKFALDQSAIVATTDTRGLITSVNDKFCEISKYRRDELLGRDHRILNSGHHPKAFMRNLWATIGRGHVWRGEIRNRAKDGSRYWVDTTIVPFADGRGKPHRFVAIRYEITDRKRSEELMREQAALTRLGEMAAVVAHEVKNPIAGIRGALQVILGRMPFEQRDRRILTDIIARLDALNGIVQDLLIYARPRAPRYEPLNILVIIESTAELLRKDPEMAGLSIHVTGAPPPLAGDPDQLRILFQNVFMNAGQAMKGDGTIAVMFSPDPKGCRITVRDHGPGMTAEALEKAFDPFYTTKHRGTGLGLAIARRVIDAHGGDITLRPSDNGGTIVSMWLPVSPPPH
jgi:PAS domain S-box-containing protein